MTSQGLAPVGVIGVGLMGRGFVHNLSRDGHAVVCYDRSQRALALIEREGAQVAASTADLVNRARFIITMLPGRDEVREVVLGEEGILESASRDHVLIEMSTIDPMTIVELGDRLASSGTVILDGGVSASPKLNWEGKGTVMVGGDAAALEAAKPILKSLCSTLIYTGDLGSAKVAKLINNTMAAVAMAAASESFALGMSHGVDPSILYQGMLGSWARCAILERMPPIDVLRPEEADAEYPDFHIGYMTKDLASALDTYRTAGTSHVMAKAAHRLFEQAQAAGLGPAPIWKLIEALPRDES